MELFQGNVRTLFAEEEVQVPELTWNWYWNCSGTGTGTEPELVLEPVLHVL